MNINDIKEGMLVQVKSLAWYEANKEDYGAVELPGCDFYEEYTEYCGYIFSLDDIDPDDETVMWNYIDRWLSIEAIEPVDNKTCEGHIIYGD